MLCKWVKKGRKTGHIIGAVTAKMTVVNSCDSNGGVVVKPVVGLGWSKKHTENEPLFSKKTGKEVAEGRAEKAYLNLDMDDVTFAEQLDKLVPARLHRDLKNMRLRAIKYFKQPLAEPANA